MSRLADLVVVFAAVAIAALIGFKVVPATVSSPGGRAVDNVLLYHPGKVARILPEGTGCLASGCHSGSPHKREVAYASFRNMHSVHVDCLVCHASDGTSRFEGKQAGTGRSHLKYTGGVPGKGPKGHPVLGSAAGCRRCHSEAGVRLLKERGLPSVPSNYADPIALRMQEGGARRWNP